MYLRAVSIGYAVPDEGFDALVYSVFQSSINLRLNRINRLLTLTTSSEDDLPQGIDWMRRLGSPLKNSRQANWQFVEMVFRTLKIAH